MLSTLYINDFNLYGRTYRVQLEAQPRFREKPETSAASTCEGQRCHDPDLHLIRTEFRAAPAWSNGSMGFTSAVVNGAPKPGYSSGQMLDAVERLAQSEFIPRGVGYGFSGQSFAERAAGGQGALVFVLGLTMVFLVLAAQYESWSIPFAVLLGVPFGAFGAFLGVWLRHMSSDVYFQIGLWWW
jgi:multidrug efflux pump subunit AcrB